MASYILKRLLLMIPTLFGVLLLTFVVVQFVPGGPVEQMVAQLQGRDAGGEGAASAGAGYRGRQGVDEKRIAEIRQLYGFDKPAHERFIQMLGQFARFDLGTSEQWCQPRRLPLVGIGAVQPEGRARIDEHQGTHHTGVAQRKLQRDHATHRQPDHMRRATTVCDQARGRIGSRLEAEIFERQ